MPEPQMRLSSSKKLSGKRWQLLSYKRLKARSTVQMPALRQALFQRDFFSGERTKEEKAEREGFQAFSLGRFDASDGLAFEHSQNHREKKACLSVPNGKAFPKTAFRKVEEEQGPIYAV